MRELILDDHVVEDVRKHPGDRVVLLACRHRAGTVGDEDDDVTEVEVRKPDRGVWCGAGRTFVIAPISSGWEVRPARSASQPGSSSSTTLDHFPTRRRDPHRLVA